MKTNWLKKSACLNKLRQKSVYVFIKFLKFKKILNYSCLENFHVQMCDSTDFVTSLWRHVFDILWQWAICIHLICAITEIRSVEQVKHMAWRRGVCTHIIILHDIPTDRRSVFSVHFYYHSVFFRLYACICVSYKTDFAHRQRLSERRFIRRVRTVTFHFSIITVSHAFSWHPFVFFI